MRRAARDEGQLLVLAGMVLILAFLLAVFGVSELNSQKNRLAQGPENELAVLFRENREKIAATLDGLALPGTDNATFMQFFNSTRDEVEQKGRGHGVHVIVSMANGTEAYAMKSEYHNFTELGASSLACLDPTDLVGTVLREYNAWSYNGSRDYVGKDWDCKDDGILWDLEAGEIRGAVVHLYMATTTVRLDETFVLAVN